jgi:hypothetical protein
VRNLEYSNSQRQGLGVRNEELLFNRVSVWEEENVLEADCGNGYIATLMELMPRKCTLKDG